MEDTIFNFIDSVLFKKNILNTLNEGETQFNLYMLNRWCSMYSPDLTQVLNETANIYGKSFVTKQEQYEFVLNMFPKVKKKRINYIKKNKEEKIPEDTDINYIAKLSELSKREIKLYIDFIQNIDN